MSRLLALSGGGTEERAGALLAALRDREDHAERLDVALREVAAAAGTDAAHLYLADPGGRLLLERGVGGGARTEATGRGAPADALPISPSADDADEGAPLELAADLAGREGAIQLPAGRFHAAPFPAGAAARGAVLAGPLAGGGLSRGARRAVEALVPALEVVALASRREHDLRCRLSAVEAREDAGRRLAGQAVEPGRYIELLLELSLRATRADGGFVAIAAATGDLRVRARAGFGAELDALDLSPATGIFDWSPATEGGALIVVDLEAVVDAGIHSLLAVPLLSGDDPLGVFAVADLSGNRPFDPRALDVLSSFARQIELMLDNERVYARFAHAYLASLQGLASALDERRPETRGHHAEVERLARAVAGRLGLPGERIDALAVAASIHDIGLAGVAQSEHAYEVDQEHPTIGAGMVEHLPVDGEIADAIACHHEWHDGWGFPRGLRGEDMPVTGRVLAAAEFAAELRAGAAGREPWDARRVADEVTRRRATQFDPAVADALIAVLVGDRDPSDGEDTDEAHD